MVATRGWLATVENEEAITELLAVSRQAVADLIEARFGSRSDVGLQLCGEPFTHLRLASKRIVIVVLGVGLLHERHGSGRQEETEPHRYSVCRKETLANSNLVGSCAMKTGHKAAPEPSCFLPMIWPRKG